MPRIYKRKIGVIPRATWTEEALATAMVEMEKKIIGINEIARTYGIPSRTLRRRFAKKDSKKLTLGKHPVLGFDNEKRLVAHIQKLEKAGFPPERSVIRQLAYEFAEKLEIKHSFNKETKMAGTQWLQTFLERHSELSIRQAEGLSMARAQGLNREEVRKMFDLLINILTENDLLDKPDRIFNMDETGVQMNNNTGKVIATKGTKVVNSITSSEKGETVSVIACMNAIGNYLPPVVIMKGVHRKPEFIEGLPSGSKVFMNKKSAYANTEIFSKWLIEHFIPHKPQGKVVLILDGHSSHSSAVDMLEIAEQNGIIMLCLPSHTTQALQPLDRSFFKPFKTFFTAETNTYIRTHPEKKITRYQAGKLIGNAWIRAAIPANAISGFKACGIYPINPDAVPESFFAISDSTLSEIPSEEPIQVEVQAQRPNNAPENPESTIHPDSTSPIQVEIQAQRPNNAPDNPESTIHPESTSPAQRTSVDHNLTRPESEKETPSKLLQEASPIPRLPAPMYKRGKQSAAILNSVENIAVKKNKKGKSTPGIPVKRSNKNDKSTVNPVTPITKIKKVVTIKPEKSLKRRRVAMRIDSASSSTSSDSENIEYQNESSDDSDFGDFRKSVDQCSECLKKTTSSCDWIQCIMCNKWLHETCTLYGDYCNRCGRKKILALKKVE